MKEQIANEVRKIGRIQNVTNLGKLCGVLNTDCSVLAARIQPQFDSKLIWQHTKLQFDVIDAVAEAFAELCLLKVATKDQLYSKANPNLKLKRLDMHKLGFHRIDHSGLSAILEKLIVEFNIKHKLR
jgi:hypothetical protein